MPPAVQQQLHAWLDHLSSESAGATTAGRAHQHTAAAIHTVLWSTTKPTAAGLACALHNQTTATGHSSAGPDNLRVNLASANADILCLADERPVSHALRCTCAARWHG
jgi:hypothetical protein